MYAAGAGAIRLAEPLGSLDLGTVSEGHGCLSDTRAPAWVHGRLTWGLGSGRPLTFPSPSPSRIRAPGMRGCRAVPSRSSGMAGASYRPEESICAVRRSVPVNSLASQVWLFRTA